MPAQDVADGVGGEPKLLMGAVPQLATEAFSAVVSGFSQLDHLLLQSRFGLRSAGGGCDRLARPDPRSGSGAPTGAPLGGWSARAGQFGRCSRSAGRSAPVSALLLACSSRRLAGTKAPRRASSLHALPEACPREDACFPEPLPHFPLVTISWRRDQIHLTNLKNCATLSSAGDFYKAAQGGVILEVPSSKRGRSKNLQS